MASGCSTLARWAASSTISSRASGTASGDRLAVERRRGGVVGAGDHERRRADARRAGRARSMSRDRLAAAGVALGRRGAQHRVEPGDRRRPRLEERRREPALEHGVGDRLRRPSPRTVARALLPVRAAARAAPRCSRARAARSGPGRSLATHIAVMPPSDSPQNETRSISSRSSSASRSPPRSAIEYGPGGHRRVAVPALVVAQQAEALGQRAGLVVPHAEARPERVEQDERRAVALDAVVHLDGHPTSFR